MVSQCSAPTGKSYWFYSLNTRNQSSYLELGPLERYFYTYGEICGPGTSGTLIEFMKLLWHPEYIVIHAQSRTVTHSHAQSRTVTHSHAQSRTVTHSHAVSRTVPRTVLRMP
jgi:hypothetical protein